MPNTRFILCFAVVLILTATLVVPAAHGDTIAVTFSSTPTSFRPNGDQTRGWEFSTSMPINVTALGLWDFNGDGFANAHQVGIWNTSSVLLTSLTLASGTSAPLIGPDSFRFEMLGTPLFLAAGTYRIGAAYIVGDADFVAFQAGPVGAQGITYIGSRLNDGGFGDPNLPSAATGGAFGPNFLFTFTPAPVSEPSNFLLLSTGMFGLVVRTRRNR